MIWTSQENWYSWSYSNKRFSRQEGDQIFKTQYGSFNGEILNFKEELLSAAKSTLDYYPNLRPCIFFSGGVDSELILRSYIEIGSNPKVYIVRYENDWNIYDVSYAVTICSMLNQNYTIIDFSLEKFFLNEAEKISEDSQIDRPRMLPHLKFADLVDGLAIVGHSDVRWYRSHDDYTKSAEWLAQDFEHDIGCDKYNILKSRSAIYQWWKWTPGLVLSYTKLRWFRMLIADGFYGKLGINSTKIQGFREIYPDLISRKKQTGFENIDSLINDFESFLRTKHNGLPYRQTQDRTLNALWREIKGTDYPEY
jgi:hypothetical protein